MYDAWTADQRHAIMWSIINLGLRFGVNVYTQATGASGYSWWTAVDGNWNCVSLLSGTNLSIEGTDSKLKRLTGLQQGFDDGSSRYP